MTIVNEEAARAWDEEGAFWVEHEEAFNQGARRYHARLLDAAAITAGEHVLDIGCGCGQTTRDAARAGASALGVDLSVPMLARARDRARSEGVANATFERADAQVHPFSEASFDVVISRFGVMFFADRAAAFSNIARAMRPGARLAMVAWQAFEKNEWLVAIRSALAAGRTFPDPPVGAPGPFGLADAEAVRAMLADAGFIDVELDDLNETMFFGDTIEDAFTFITTIGPTRGLLDELDDPARASALERLRETLKDHVQEEGVGFGSRAWLISARRG